MALMAQGLEEMEREQVAGRPHIGSYYVYTLLPGRGEKRVELCAYFQRSGPLSPMFLEYS